VRCVNENSKKRNWQRKRQPTGMLGRSAVATMIGCLPMQALAFLAVFVYTTHATHAIAFEWKPGLNLLSASFFLSHVKYLHFTFFVT